MIAYYQYFFALHLISVISWMAGLFYLPRLFVYHVESIPGGEAVQKFEIMERKLLRFIMNPAMILTWVFGLTMVYLMPDLLKQGWFHVKLTLVVLMSVFHMACAKWRSDLVKGIRKSSRFFRIVNEIPTILMILIVFLVVLKPF